MSRRGIFKLRGDKSKGLDDLDKELERRGLRFARYADDFQIFVRSQRSAQRVFESVKRFLTQRLRLVVNEEKSSVRPALGCEFLGFTFIGKRVTIKVAPKKLKAFKQRVKELTGRSRGISMKRRMTDLNGYVRGWIGYFGIARQFDDIADLDGCHVFQRASRAVGYACATGNSGVSRAPR